MITNETTLHMTQKLIAICHRMAFNNEQSLLGNMYVQKGSMLSYVAQW